MTGGTKQKIALPVRWLPSVALLASRPMLCLGGRNIHTITSTKAQPAKLLCVTRGRIRDSLNLVVKWSRPHAG